LFAGVAILQQHDMARNTPISLAQQRGHRQLAAELEQLRQQALNLSRAPPAVTTALASDK
jgi:hypothetical protein